MSKLAKRYYVYSFILGDCSAVVSIWDSSTGLYVEQNLVKAPPAWMQKIGIVITATFAREIARAYRKCVALNQLRSPGKSETEKIIENMPPITGPEVGH